MSSVPLAPSKKNDILSHWTSLKVLPPHLAALFIPERIRESKKKQKKNETKNGKKLFIEAANTIFPQMFLCCYINSPPYARDHRPRVMARNKECCLSDGGAEKVIEGQTVSGTLEGQ